jgi:hypothetical protein
MELPPFPHEASWCIRGQLCLYRHKTKGVDSGKAMAVRWSAERGTALSDSRSKDTTTAFIHTPWRCVRPITRPARTERKGKGKGLPVHTMKVGLQDRSRGTAPLIFILDTRKRSVGAFTPRPLYPQGKSPRYPLNRRLRGPHSRSGRFGEETKILPLAGNKRFHDRPARSLITTPTELPRFPAAHVLDK